jgi:hypothetical protein
MVLHPAKWLDEDTLLLPTLKKFKDQGRRTLEVINAYESKLPHRKKAKKV